MSSVEQILDMTEKYGMVVELNGNGEIIRSLQDPTGNHVAAVSEVNRNNISSCYHSNKNELLHMHCI